MHPIGEGDMGATTLTLKVRIGKVTATALVDSGNTTTFITPSLVRRANLEIENYEPIPVKVANGEILYTRGTLSSTCIPYPRGRICIYIQGVGNQRI